MYFVGFGGKNQEKNIEGGAAHGTRGGCAFLTAGGWQTLPLAPKPRSARVGFFATPTRSIPVIIIEIS
jgi:hypothetical protein